MKTGLTSGCFDLIHYGHLHYLQRCKELCDVLVVGVDSDRLVKEVKGDARPIIPEDERQLLIKSLSVVDYAFILNKVEDLTNAVRMLNVNYVFKHQGYEKVPHIYGVDDTDAKLVIVPDIPNLKSTTWIINKIQELSII